jgi:hypothetical protein
MLSINKYCGIFSRITLVLVYVSFFLVQLNIHFSGSPVVSFFSSGYNSSLSQKISHPYSSNLTHRDSGRNGIKLNKRFHPQKLFITPGPSRDLTRSFFNIQHFFIHQDQLLPKSFLLSPSLRGPPEMV